MKKISRIALITSTMLGGINIIYVIRSIEVMNILQFFTLCILIPCVLSSVIIAGLVIETPFQKIKQQAIIVSILGAVIGVFAYILAEKNQHALENIVENSKNIAGSLNLAVSNISINSGFSSYIFIFIMIFVLSMGFDILFNILQGEEKNDVYKQK